MHSQARRYLSPEEHPFFPERLKDPVLPPVEYPPVLVQQEIININPNILDVYIHEVGAPSLDLDLRSNLDLHATRMGSRT